MRLQFLQVDLYEERGRRGERRKPEGKGESEERRETQREEKWGKRERSVGEEGE